MSRLTDSAVSAIYGIEEVESIWTDARRLRVELIVSGNQQTQRVAPQLIARVGDCKCTTNRQKQITTQIVRLVLCLDAGDECVANWFGG